MMDEPIHISMPSSNSEHSIHKSALSSATPAAPSSASSSFTTSAHASMESIGRVVMYYRFAAPVIATAHPHAHATNDSLDSSSVMNVTANSSFLFAATVAGLEVWSLWSPCHHVAAQKAFEFALLMPPPSQPQLLGIRPWPSTHVHHHAALALVALDAHVIVLTCATRGASHATTDITHAAINHLHHHHHHVLSNASAVAAAFAPTLSFEMRPQLHLDPGMHHPHPHSHRPHEKKETKDARRKIQTKLPRRRDHAHIDHYLHAHHSTHDDHAIVLIYPQSPPAAIFKSAKVLVSTRF